MTHKNAIFAVIAIILLVSSSVLFMLDDRRNDAGAPEQTLASADFEFDSMKRSDGDRFFEFERTILSSELGIDLLFEDCGEYAYIYATAAVDDSRRSVSINAHIYSGGKEGFLSREVPLAPAEAIRSLFIRLKERGFDIAVATGRAREEMEIPFKIFHWYEEFDPLYLATASDAVEASEMFHCPVPDKPQPFIFSCAVYGRKRENYEAYLKEAMKPLPDDEIYVCGDSYSDVLGSRRAGTKFIGILTGLEGKGAAPMFERENVPSVDRITDIEKVIFGR